jgi:hypothetical protein
MAIGKESMRPGSFWRFIEGYIPAMTALIVSALIFYCSGSISERFSCGLWKSSNLYSAIFNWAAIQIGFSFGVYGFVLGKSSGFIFAARNTIAMRNFLKYVRAANLAGFLLTVASIPIIVWDPKLVKPMSTSYVLVTLWFGLFSWSFLSFLRLAYNFGLLTSVKEVQFHGA